MSNSNTTPEPATSNNVLIRGIDSLIHQDDDDEDTDTVGFIDRVSYRYFGEWFKDRNEEYEQYQQTVNEARLDNTWDEHLAKTVFLTIIFAGVGALVGITTSLVVTAAGLWLNLPVPISSPVPLSSQTVNILGSVLLTLLLALVFAGFTYGYLYTKPRREAYRRKREITQLLPQMITYIYAHSQSGMHLVDIIERLADEEEAYGEVAREFQAIHNSMEFFGADMTTALQEARRATPNDDFATLLDDLVSYVNTGGELSKFLEKKTREFQRKARRREEHIIEQMDMVAQTYLVLGVALPLIVLVTFVVMTALGGAPLAILYVVVYVALPLLGVLFIVIHDSLTADASTASPDLPAPTTPPTPELINKRLEDGADPPDALKPPGSNRERSTAAARPVYSRIDGHDGDVTDREHTALLELRATLRRERVYHALKVPYLKVKERPEFSAVFTIPAAMAYLVAINILGFISLTPSGMLSAPVWTTTFGIVVPALVVLAPISYLHEQQYRYQRQVDSELPGTLRKLATVNTTGANLIENMALVSNSSTGILADELEKTHRNLQWNISLNDGLKRFANRVGNPRVTRVTKLLIESNTTSNRVTEVLTVAADAAQDQLELDNERFAAMRQKMVVIIMGYLIFLGVTVIVIIWLFPTFSETAAQTGPQSNNAGLAGLSFPTNIYRMVFYHGVLVQATIGGAVAGKFGYDSVRSGLKFAIGAIILAAGIFLFI